MWPTAVMGFTFPVTAPTLASAVSFAFSIGDQANAAGTSTCTGGIFTGSGGVACGWTGSIVAPSAAISTAAGGNGSLATYGTGNTSLATGPYAKASSSSSGILRPIPFTALLNTQTGTLVFSVSHQGHVNQALSGYVGVAGGTLFTVSAQGTVFFPSPWVARRVHRQWNHRYPVLR